MLLLPKEVRRMRELERSLVGILEGRGFQEVLLPRLVEASEWQRVVTCLGPIGEELQREAYVVSAPDRPDCVLCHWQCEPYYLALEKLRESLPPRVFDRSGWSFRNEATTDSYRFSQFQRVEAIWRGPSAEVATTLADCLGDVEALLLGQGLAVSRVERPDEVALSSQKRVVDLVTRVGQLDVEVAGFHLHGRSFIARFWPEAPEDHESGCCGISLSRLARLPCEPSSGTQS
jgi:hypothetical protein